MATMYAAKSGKPPEPKKQSDSDFYIDLVTPGTLARKTFTSPYGLHVISKMNDPQISRAPDRFLRRDRERVGAREILFPTRQRRKV